ncbi:BlaI/MecI/CopY family transcriptional regulator [Nocardioides sp. InS609-2]|uniref:BlaI/MecI/CopY family transcriptional regulator n=1 Tax=Nocardioides sp. InS609-2 TaxID=2760705 RepID=UPI0020BEE6DE|nr:BlaI/MecI/CopY family transcriptional regulator [Nocardioides sp. InS609-2]
MPNSFGGLERAVLDVLWAAASEDSWLTVREVHRALVGREVAYTTVMTVLDRLARKEQILQQRAGRAYTYRARASRSEMIADLLHGTLDEFGTHDRQSALVAFVEDASADDVEALREALARLERP